MPKVTLIWSGTDDDLELKGICSSPQAATDAMQRADEYGARWTDLTTQEIELDELLKYVPYTRWRVGIDTVERTLTKRMGDAVVLYGIPFGNRIVGGEDDFVTGRYVWSESSTSHAEAVQHAEQWLQQYNIDHPAPPDDPEIQVVGKRVNWTERPEA